jgi:dethiobiotin synthetase
MEGAWQMEIRRGLFVAGTDTGCGKTVATATLARALALRGVDVGVAKPYVTGIDPEAPAPESDICFLQQAACCSDALDEVSPARFRLPLAPANAAALEGRRVERAQVVAQTRAYAGRHSVTLVEGIGGVAVPLDVDYLVSDFIRDLDLSVLLVARSALGTINHTMLTAEHLRHCGVRVAGVVFNRTCGGPLTQAELVGPPVAAQLAGLHSFGILPYVAGADGDRPPPVKALPVGCEAVAQIVELVLGA